MKAKDLNEYLLKLQQWREARHLSVEGQQKGLLGNLLEKLSKVARAKDNESLVGELCDVIIVCMNAKNIPIQEPTSEGICGIIGVLDELQEIAMSLFDLEHTNMRLESTLESIIHTCIRTIENLGYDSRLSLDMTIDKIMSRTGHFDTELNKFIKDVGKEAQAKWIEPDYELARYINVHKPCNICCKD